MQAAGAGTDWTVAGGASGSMSSGFAAASVSKSTPLLTQRGAQQHRRSELLCF